jgi:uncharacterized protein involved in response to NO
MYIKYIFKKSKLFNGQEQDGLFRYPVFNLGFRPFFLLALAGANLVIHLQALGVLLASGSNLALQFTLNAITLIMVVIGGRVMPFFTANVLSEVQVRRLAWADILAIGLGDPAGDDTYRNAGVVLAGVHRIRAVMVDCLRAVCYSLHPHFDATSD